MGRRALASWLVAIAFGCGGDDDTVRDAGVVDASREDAGGEDAGRDAGVIAPAAPAPPAMLPCPDGWTERAIDAGDGAPAIVGCVPFASTGPDPCGDFEAHFVGAPGCARVGPACPVDGWPVGVDAAAIHVDPAAAPGGDGSRGAPLATLADAVARVPSDGTIALRTGAYASMGELVLDRSMRVVGACGEATQLALRHFGAGIRITAGATVSFEAVAMRGVLFDALSVEAGATAELHEVVVFGTSGTSIHARGGTVRGDHVLVRDAVDFPGTALWASEGGVIDLEELAVRNAAGMAILGSTKSNVRLVNAVVDQRASDFGGGIRVDTATLAVERVGVYGATEIAIAAIDGTLSVSDAYVRDTTSEPMVGGVAVGIVHSGSGTVDRLFAEANSPGTLTTSAAGGELVVRDTIVLEGLSDTSGRFGRGLEVSDGAHATLERVAVVASTDVALLVRGDGTGLDASDVIVADTRSETASGAFGRAVHVQQGGSATVRRVLAARNREVTMSASGAGSTLTVEDATIVDTAVRDCARTSCPDQGAGIGVASIDGSHVTVTRFTIARNALAGVQLASGGTMDLSHGVIADNPVGANVQTEPFDATRLSNQVTYRGNGQNLDASRLTVPEPAAGL